MAGCVPEPRGRIQHGATFGYRCSRWVFKPAPDGLPSVRARQMLPRIAVGLDVAEEDGWRSTNEGHGPRVSPRHGTINASA
jgi:hypothetical protein